MNYELTNEIKYNIFEKACNMVADKLDIEPYLVYIDMLKYIEGHFNTKIKVYVVVDSKDNLEFDDTFYLDNSEIHVRLINVDTLLNVRKYRVAMLLSNFTNSIAVVNSKSINDLMIRIMNSVYPLEILEEIESKINGISAFLENEKDFTAYNKMIISRAMKYIYLFGNLSETWDIYTAYYETVKQLKDSEIIGHLMTNIPILEKVELENVQATIEANNFNKIKEQIKNTCEFVRQVIEVKKRVLQSDTETAE